MKNKIILIWLFVFAMYSGISVNAINITRYVAEGGMGDGLTKENPSGNLYAVLKLSTQVDGLTVYLAPGTYNLPKYDNANARRKYGCVSIYGGGSTKAENLEQKSVITGDLNLNGGFVINIDFKGSRVGNQTVGYLDGAISGCNVYYSNASLIDMTLSDGTTYMLGVNAATAVFQKYGSAYQRPALVIKDCNFENGMGLAVSGLSVKIEDCYFENNKSTALEINNCEGALVKHCTFKDNIVSGAVLVTDLTDDYAAIFDQCAFCKNATTKSQYSSVLTTRSPVLMRNCLISKNYSDVNDKNANRNHQHKGCIEVTRRQSTFLNCTFYNNANAVIYYNMEPADQARIGMQFINSVFLGNQSPFYSEKGNKPVMNYCAADFGSDIPELDAERNNIRIDANSAKMDVSGNDVFLQEGSRLINAGKPMILNDQYRMNRYLLGGTDLGCAEYMGGKWKKTPDAAVMNIGSRKYVKCCVTYENKTYYGWALEKYIFEDGTISIFGMLYTGDMLAPVKVLDAENAIVYMTFDGKKAAILYTIDGECWEAQNIMPYTTTRPTAVKGAKGWLLKAGTPTATSPAKRKTTTGSSRARR